MKRAVATALAWFTLAGSLIAKPAPVTLTVSPRIGPAPLNVRATMVFDPALDDDLACLLVEASWDTDDSDGRLEQTCVPVTGKQHTMQIRALEAGDYGFQAVIRPGKGNAEARSAVVRVIVR